MVDGYLLFIICVMYVFILFFYYFIMYYYILLYNVLLYYLFIIDYYTVREATVGTKLHISVMVCPCCNPTKIYDTCQKGCV